MTKKTKPFRMFRLSKSLIRKCSTLPLNPPNESKLSIFEWSAMGGTVIGGCVGVNLMYNTYNEIKEEDNRWGNVLKFVMLLGGAIFGASFGAIVGWSFPVTFPILGLVIWDGMREMRKKKTNEITTIWEKD